MNRITLYILFIYYITICGRGPLTKPRPPSLFGCGPLTKPRPPSLFGCGPLTKPRPPSLFGCGPLTKPRPPSLFGCGPLTKPRPPSLFGCGPLTKLWSLSYCNVASSTFRFSLVQQIKHLRVVSFPMVNGDMLD